MNPQNNAQTNRNGPTYENHIESMVRYMQHQNYTFEVTKCCGYSTFILVNRSGTLLDLYREISIFFECPDIKSLYFIHPDTRDKLRVPVTDSIKIRDFFVSHHRDYFTPVYPIPKPVVYRVYLDDGHFHLPEEPHGVQCNTVQSNTVQSNTVQSNTEDKVQT